MKDVEILEKALSKGCKDIPNEKFRIIFVFFEFMLVCISMFFMSIILYQINTNENNDAPYFVFVILASVISLFLFRAYLMIKRSEGSAFSGNIHDNYLSLNDKEKVSYEKGIELHNKNSIASIEYKDTSIIKISDVLIAIYALKQYT